MFLPPPGEGPKAPPDTPLKDTTSLQKHDGIDDETYVYAMECMLKGSKPSEVRRSLLAAGHSDEEADEIVQTALKYRNQHADASTGSHGSRNMLIGGLVCLVGLVITVGSFLATSGTGGRYVVAYGAIVWGGIQFFRGLAQSKTIE